MRKIIAILLVVVLTLSLFAGCGQEGEKTGKPKVGIIGMSAIPSKNFQATSMNMDAIAEAAGIELVRVELSTYGDEGFLAAYESMIAQGVDAAVVYTFSEAVLPLITDMLEKADVKYFLANRKISNEEVRKDIFDNPNLIGNDYCDEIQGAYDMVKHLHEKYGAKNLAVIGLQSGDTNGDLRDLGIKKACDEFGIKLLTETRGITTVEDIANAVNGFAGAYKEMDSIFIVGGLVTPGALAGVNQALKNNNLTGKVNIAMIDIATGMGEYMDEGPLKIVAGGNLIFDQILSLIAAANEVQGTPIKDDAYIINTKMMYITSAQEAEDYDFYVESITDPVFTVEELNENFFKFKNSKITLESFQEYVSNFTVAALKASRTK